MDAASLKAKALAKVKAINDALMKKKNDLLSKNTSHMMMMPPPPPPPHNDGQVPLSYPQCANLQHYAGAAQAGQFPVSRGTLEHDRQQRAIDDPANLTLSGLRKTGYKGGPVVGEREARGLKYGLHRKDFKPPPTPVVLLLGVEVAAAAAVSFPLLDRLCGPNDAFLNDAMARAPGSFVTVRGRGVFPYDQEFSSEPLHLYISAQDDHSMAVCSQICDGLAVNVRKEFEACRQQAYVHNMNAMHVNMHMHIHLPMNMNMNMSMPPVMSTNPNVTDSHALPPPPPPVDSVAPHPHTVATAAAPAAVAATSPLVGSNGLAATAAAAVTASAGEKEYNIESDDESSDENEASEQNPKRRKVDGAPGGGGGSADSAGSGVTAAAPMPSRLSPLNEHTVPTQDEPLQAVTEGSLSSSSSSSSRSSSSTAQRDTSIYRSASIVIGNPNCTPLTRAASSDGVPNSLAVSASTPVPIPVPAPIHTTNSTVTSEVAAKSASALSGAAALEEYDPFAAGDSDSD